MEASITKARKGHAGAASKVTFSHAETDAGLKLLAREAVSAQFGAIFAIFMLLEQLGAGKRNRIKNAQYAQLSHP